MGRAFGDAVERANHKAVRVDDTQLATLIQALPAAIYTTDAAGHITFYNEAAAELWGCRPELGKSEFCGSWTLYWPDGTPIFPNPIQSCSNSNSPVGDGTWKREWAESRLPQCQLAHERRQFRIESRNARPQLELVIEGM
jgi:PAS domain-containing protein